MGKVASPPRSRAGRSSQMAGNGTCAASRMEIDYVPIRLPVSGANWRRTNHMRTSRRADCLRTGSDRGWGRSETGMGRALPHFSPKLRPVFQAERGATGDATGVERARRGRADRVAGPEVRICSIPSQKGAFSGPPIGTWSASRQPAPIGNGTGGPEARSPWLEPSLVAGPPARPCPNGRALARTPPNGLPIGGDRGHLATTPPIGLAEWQHPASPCETGCE